jgi:hypothetical protein
MPVSTRPRPLAALTILAAIAGPVASAAGDVTVTERLSSQTHYVLAGTGAFTDEYDVTLTSDDLSTPFVETQTYNAFMFADSPPSSAGEAAATGTTLRDDRLIFEGGSLVQVISSASAFGTTEHISGGGTAQLSTQNNFAITFTVTEPTEITLEGVMNPATGDFAEVRLQATDSLFPVFRFRSLDGDSGPYLHRGTLAPGEYRLKADLLFYDLRNAQTDPPVFTDSGDYTMTFTLGDGPTDCPADVDGNGGIDTSDLIAVLAAWGDCPGCEADLDGNGFVDTADLIAVLAAWGPCPG